MLGDPEVTAILYCNFAFLYWEVCVICSIYLGQLMGHPVVITTKVPETHRIILWPKQLYLLSNIWEALRPYATMFKWLQHYQHIIFFLFPGLLQFLDLDGSRGGNEGDILKVINVKIPPFVWIYVYLKSENGPLIFFLDMKLLAWSGLNSRLSLI